MRGESGRRGWREGLRECKGRESGGAEGETRSLLLADCLCTGITSGVDAGITSGGTCNGGDEDGVGVQVAPTLGKTDSPPASLGVEMWLLSYVSSVTWTEKEVLEGEVREHDSQEQLV